MIHGDVAQRRARLVARHGLAEPFTSVEDAAAALVGLHSSDPATVYLAARARVTGFLPTDLGRALYEDRTLVRMLGMRRTLFVVPRDLAAVMQTACTRGYLAAERRRLLGMIAGQGFTADPGSWMESLERDTLTALRTRGEATAVELTGDVPELATRIHYGQGTFGISTRVLFLLATAGQIVRARPRGTWVSTQYRWAPVEAWLGAPLDEPDPDEAARDLVRRWLSAFGPGTETDLKWWSGWTLGRTRKVLQEIGAMEVSLDDGPGYLLPNDLDPVASPGPQAALLPGLDPTVMGWKERAWYLGDHAARLFDRNGNAGPTIWWDGAVVGGWAQREDGEIALGLLADVGRDADAAIRDEAARLEAWLGGMRITPRFRTPLEKELRG